MTLQLSVPVRNAGLEAYETAIGPSPILTIRTGNQPTNCAAANSGTVLATITLPADWMAAAANGTKQSQGTWLDNAADASGFAGHYRIHQADGTVCHLQGPVAQAHFTNTFFTAGARVVNAGNVYVCVTGGTTGANSAPTGTGTGITDGGAVWNYVSDAKGIIVVDNTNFSVNQPFSITSYTWTAGNA